MKCTVIGKRRVDFKNKETDEHIQSASVSVMHKYPPNNDSVHCEGDQCSEVTIPFEYIDSINIGDKLLLDFDKKGKLLEMELLS